MTFTEKNGQYIPIINQALARYMEDSGAPEALNAAMNYSLVAGGKRLRPCLTLLSCEMLGGDIYKALPFGCALEMIHTYSLIHDDLPCMDNDDFRRGKPSNHKVFGEANAVLAGDGLLSYAFQIMLDAIEAEPAQGAIRAARTVSIGAGVQGMIAGQAADLASETDPRPNELTLRFIQSNKTAAMIKAALLAGAHIAEASEEELSALARFGESYGALFQMTDDILDIEGSFENMGKTIGKDKDENKLTYPALIGLEGAKEKARQTAERAAAALDIFGERARYLRELTNHTLGRKK